MECEYFQKLKTYNYGDLIKETKYWLIILAPDQKNLGTIVVALKRDEINLSGVNNDEWVEFVDIVRELESSLQKAFPVTMFNWGCLLNSAYNKEPPDPHVHWHLIPRYKKEVKFYGMTFQDPCFGKSTMYARIDSPPVNADIRKEIKEQISNYLNI